MVEHSKSVPLHTVVATILWCLGLTLILLEVILELTHHGDRFVGVGALGVFLAMGGATLTVRSYFCRFAKRENDAFSLGREVGRSEEGSDVRRLR